MLTKTNGIIVRTIKYGDSSAITKIYTETFGLLGFHIPAVFKNKGAIKPSHLQPLNCIEFSFNHSTTKNLFSIKDLNCLFYFNSSLFVQQAYYNVISELVAQTIKENEQNHSLFNYLFHHLIPSLNEHSNFWQLPTAMLQLLHHYGCAPNTENYREDYILDLQNGIFIENLMTNRLSGTSKVSWIIYNILDHGSEKIDQNIALRQQTIETLITYYKLHINESFDLKSRDILWQVMKG